MAKDTEAHTASCDQSLWFKCKPENATLENIQTTHPLELLHLDFLTIEATEDGKDVHA